MPAYSEAMQPPKGREGGQPFPLSCFEIKKTCHDYKGRELLPLMVSDAARTGDADAVEQVLLHQVR